MAISNRGRQGLDGSARALSKPAIRRMARRGGVKRMHGFLYDESRIVFKEWLTKVIKDSVTYTDHAHRKTVMACDVVQALQFNGHTIYGFGDHCSQGNVSSVTGRHRTQQRHSAIPDPDASQSHGVVPNQRWDQPGTSEGLAMLGEDGKGLKKFKTSSKKAPWMQPLYWVKDDNFTSTFDQLQNSVDLRFVKTKNWFWMVNSDLDVPANFINNDILDNTIEAALYDMSQDNRLFTKQPARLGAKVIASLMNEPIGDTSTSILQFTRSTSKNQGKQFPSGNIVLQGPWNVNEAYTSQSLEFILRMVSLVITSDNVRVYSGGEQGHVQTHIIREGFLTGLRPKNNHTSKSKCGDASFEGCEAVMVGDVCNSTPFIIMYEPINVRNKLIFNIRVVASQTWYQKNGKWEKLKRGYSTLCMERILQRAKEYQELGHSVAVQMTAKACGKNKFVRDFWIKAFYKLYMNHNDEIVLTLNGQQLNSDASTTQALKMELHKIPRKLFTDARGHRSKHCPRQKICNEKFTIKEIKARHGFLTRWQFQGESVLDPNNDIIWEDSDVDFEISFRFR